MTARLFLFGSVLLLINQREKKKNWQEQKPRTELIEQIEMSK